MLNLHLNTHTHITHTPTPMHTHIPVAMDEGIESQSIIPATGEVNHIDLRTEIMDIQEPT